LPRNNNRRKPFESRRLRVSELGYILVFFSSSFIICLKTEIISAAEDSKNITLMLHIEQPDIILVEKMDDINCYALILNVSNRQIISAKYLRGKYLDLKVVI
jgi:hypothetical protein